MNVSVIVPIYNVEEYLEECLDSIASQTIAGLEVILVDDGSTDNSGKIAQRYADSHENFVCYHIKNGGLGHARNFGAQFAHGKYICFADSDDIIPPYAYQDMFILGEKHSCDIVVGDVRRFNSRREYSSSLHRRAFRNAREVMHITKDHDLLYDTTSWNKLFRRDFYVEKSLKWAEGIMYEDIPVTIPAHYMARSVAYLNKVVYLWRARDGVSASITQRREELSNFLDRFAVMKKVDAFFDANVSDLSLHLDKDVKWLSLDFKMYVDKLAVAEDEYRDAVVDAIADYLPKMNPEAFARIKAIDRMKYYFISRKDVEGLLGVLAYERRGMKTLRIRRVDEGKYYGRFPFECPRALFDMTDELRSAGPSQSISQVLLNDRFLEVSGNVAFSQVDVMRRSDVSLAASVVSEGSSDLLSCQVELSSPHRWLGYNVSRDYGKLTLRARRFSRFVVRVDTEKLSRLPEGRYHISYTYGISGLSCDAQLLKNPAKGSLPRPFAMLMGGKKVSIDYDLNFCLCISVSDCAVRVERVRPVACDSVELALSDGSLVERRVGEVSKEWMSLNDAYFESVPRFIPWGDGLFYYVASREGTLGMHRLPSGGIVDSCSVSGRVLNIGATLSALSVCEIRRVMLMGVNYRVLVNVPFFSEAESGAVSRVRIRIDLGDSSQTELLRDDLYELSGEGVTATGSTVRIPFYSGLDKRELAYKVVEGSYTYAMRLYEKTPTLSVRRQPGFFDRTKRRRRIVQRYAYPIMRRLPLKKNWIVFESSWGAKTDCNPGALYRYISVSHPEFTCIWSLNDPRIALNGKARRVVKGSFGYFYALSRAKYLINNVNFIDAYEKRPGQIEIQTMHGTPLKTLGLDVPGELPTQAHVDAFLRRCNRWDYLVVQSPRAEEITRSCYAFKKTFLETGYPRNDVLFKMNNPEDISKLKEFYGLDSSKKLILYAPTWRRRAHFDLKLDLSALLDAVGDEYQVGLRVHQFALPGLDRKTLDERVLDLSSLQSMEELFLMSDVVITDYSSLMFDYAVLGRPLLFYVYDLEEYRDRLRGFNIDLESEAPGPLLFTTDEVIEAVRDLDQVTLDYQEAYQRFRDGYCSFETGHASEQIVNGVILGNDVSS